MDEELDTDTAGTEQESVKADSDVVQLSKLRSDEKGKLETCPTLDLNELQKLSSEELESLGRDFDLRLHSARPRHYHILDLIRAALGTGLRRIF